MDKKTHHILYPRQIVMVTSCSKSEKSNVITIAWSMPTSFYPPMVAISIGKSRYSHELIEECGEFVICIPPYEMLDTVISCGSMSGREKDKFKECGIELEKSRKVKPPRVAGCLAYLECKVVKSIETGDHTIFIGDIVVSEVAKKGKVIVGKEEEFVPMDF